MIISVIIFVFRVRRAFAWQPLAPVCCRGGWLVAPLGAHFSPPLGSGVPRPVGRLSGLSHSVGLVWAAL